MSDDKKTSDAVVDSELNDLLDSALEDFDKPAKVATKDESPAVSSAAQTGNVIEEVTANETWSQDFIMQTADSFERNLQNIMQNGGDGDLGSSLQKMVQSVASAIGTTEGEGEGEGVNFQAAIAQALKDLSTTSENLQNATPGISEAELAAMFGQANLEDGTGDIPPFMEGMMQFLLSKVLLYPSLKKLVDKFPAWLEEKKTTLPAADLQRYNKQHELMQKVCAELEKEKDDDSEEVKKQRFERILASMSEMQSYGEPPEELIGEIPALFQFDAEGNPVMPALPPGVEAPQNCSVM